jgi:very-short-patch-repair endonuclease
MRVSRARWHERRVAHGSVRRRRFFATFRSRTREYSIQRIICRRRCRSYRVLVELRGAQGGADEATFARRRAFIQYVVRYATRHRRVTNSSPPPHVIATLVVVANDTARAEHHRAVANIDPMR